MSSTRSDALIFVLTAVVTVCFDLIEAVEIGIVAAAFFALRSVARRSSVVREELPGPSAPGDEEIALLRLDGAMFFGAADRISTAIVDADHPRTSVVIIRMSQLGMLDATGANTLAQICTELEGRGITVIIKGVREEHAALLANVGVFESLRHEHHLVDTLDEAIEHARTHVARSLLGTQAGSRPVERHDTVQQRRRLGHRNGRGEESLDRGLLRERRDVRQHRLEHVDVDVVRLPGGACHVPPVHHHLGQRDHPPTSAGKSMPPARDMPVHAAGRAERVGEFGEPLRIAGRQSSSRSSVICGGLSVSSPNRLAAASVNAAASPPMWQTRAATLRPAHGVAPANWSSLMSRSRSAVPAHAVVMSIMSIPTGGPSRTHRGPQAVLESAQ